MTDIWKSPDGRMELRCGRWQDVLADVGQVDAVITDPPFSERTHASHYVMESVNRRSINYASLSPDDVSGFVGYWAHACHGWVVALTDHLLIPHWERAYSDAGRYSFAPLACVEPGSRVRISGDGPSQWSVFAMVARPKNREYRRWGALRGAYVLTYPATRRGAREGKNIMGAKPTALMRQIIRDYSRRNDLICDPCAGSGTTLLAAAIEGRRAIGAEMDPKTYALAVKRLSAGYTPTMF